MVPKKQQKVWLLVYLFKHKPDNNIQPKYKNFLSLLIIELSIISK